MSQRGTMVATSCLSILVTLFAACTGGGTTSTTTPPSTTDHLYRSPAGWIVKVPTGWHVRPFTSSRREGVSGAEISNGKLPPPLDTPPAPIQADGRALSQHGIGLVIATGHRLAHSAPVASLPLSYPNGSSWAMGSAGAGSPTMDTIQFRGGTMIFTVTVKMRAGTTSDDQRALAGILQSVKFQG